MQGSQVDSEVYKVVVNGRGMENDLLPRCIRYDPGISGRCHNCGLKGGPAFLRLFGLGDPGSPHWPRTILVSSPLLRVRTIFKTIEVVVRRGDSAIGLSAPLVRSVAVSIEMTNEMAPIVSTLFHCLPVLSRICDRPIHILLGWPLLCINLTLSCPSHDSSCWTHVGSPLFSDWGIEVSSCEGEAGLEGIFDPVQPLAQVDTLVDEGGGVTGSREQVWERLLDRGKYGTGRYVVMMR